MYMEMYFVRKLGGYCEMYNMSMVFYAMGV